VHVVTDRYQYSSLAYQGYGRGLDIEAVRSLSKFAEAPEADVVILLTIPASLRRERLQGRLDRIEAGDEQFHERVEKGFLELAARDPKRWVLIIATGTIEAIAELVWTEVNGRL
jgi:dTMP kinase